MSTIYSKPEIIQALDHEVAGLNEWCMKLDEPLFLTPINGKWSAAEQLEHLRKASKPLVMALNLPKFVIRLKVGRPNRKGRSFAAVQEKYETKLATESIGTTKFFPDAKLIKNREVIIHDYQKVNRQLLKVINKWSEDDLDNYILPHPLLGKLTVREMLFFTLHHTRHHGEHLKLLYA